MIASISYVAENPLGLAKHTEAYYEVRQRSVQSLAAAPLREAGNTRIFGS